MKKISVYIHIPFCKSKCFYCDFRSFANKDDDFDLYVDTLIKEIESFDFTEYVIDTIFIGGGTPTVLPSYKLCKIIESVTKNNMLDDVEITVENNPNTVDFNYLMALKKSGVNRISMGIQTTNDEMLKKIGRTHRFYDVKNAVYNAKDVGFENISGDIIMSLPSQNIENFMATMKEVMELSLQHISVYSLIIEDNTVFGNLSSDELLKLDLPSEEQDREMYHKVCEFLAENKYNQYEISNYAQNNYECRHNINYWVRNEYIGFGLAAHSFINNERFSNTSDFNSYINNGFNEKCDRNSVGFTESLEEFIFLGLRMNRGISKFELRNLYNVDINKTLGEYIKDMEKSGFLGENEERIWITTKGFDISENMIFEIISKIT